MESCNSHSRWAFGLAGVVLVLALGGCGSADVVDIEFGGLTVNTVTSGENIDPNAYSLQVTGPSLNVEQTIGVNDRVVFSVSPGSYSARLGDIAPNCAVGPNPVNVNVITGSTSNALFTLVCI